MANREIQKQLTNDHQDASSYVDWQADDYRQQGQRGSSPNRAHVDFAPQPDIGGAKQLKPVDPPCDGMQFAENPYLDHNYFDVRFDSFNQPTVKDRPMHDNATPGEGSWGGRQYSDFQAADGYSGYGVEIPHGTSAAFNKSETTYVDVSQANRGKDS